LDGACDKCDTLKFVQYTNRALNEKYIDYKEFEFKYLGHGYFVELDPKLGRKMNYRVVLDKSMIGYDFKNEYRLRFDKKKTLLSIYKEGELVMKLKPIERKIIKIESISGEDKKLLETTEITLLRIN
jgi:hypothetical protein